MGDASVTHIHIKKKGSHVSMLSWHESVKLRYKDFDFCLLARGQMILHKTSDRCHFEEQGYSVKCIITIEFQIHCIIMNSYIPCHSWSRETQLVARGKNEVEKIQWQICPRWRICSQYLRFSFVYSTTERMRSFFLTFFFVWILY